MIPPNMKSKAILEALWTAEELKFRREEKASCRCYPAVAENIPGDISIISQTPALYGAVKRVRLSDRTPLIALTFDLCEAPTEISGYDGELIDLLREQNVSATLFICGKWMRSHSERTLQLMADPLFEIGNHTWDHANLNVASEELIKRQLVLTQLEYAMLFDELRRRAAEKNLKVDHVPSLPRLLRFPYGRFGPLALQTAARLGLQPIQWDVVTEDPNPQRLAEDIYKEVTTWTAPGSIVVGHANGKGWNTREALSAIIPTLRERGYKFVSVSTLLTKGMCEFSESGYERTPEDNISYDKFGLRN